MRLIDADMLKEAFIVNTDRKGYLVADPEVIIDNAPTVENLYTPRQMQDAYLKGKRNRPQGEWLTHRVAFYLTCPFCGCNLRALKNEVFLDTDDDYNFCPNCGAEMKLKQRDCEHCKHYVEKDGSQGCEVWDCEFEKRSDL